MYITKLGESKFEGEFLFSLSCHVNQDLSKHNQLFYKYIVWVLFQMHLSRTQWDKVCFRVEFKCTYPCDFTRIIMEI